MSKMTTYQSAPMRAPSQTIGWGGVCVDEKAVRVSWESLLFTGFAAYEYRPSG